MKANIQYNIEEVYARLSYLLSGDDANRKAGTGTLGLGPIFLTPWAGNNVSELTSRETAASIYDYEMKGSGNAADAPSFWATEQVRAAVAAGLVPESLRSGYTQATTRAEFCALAVALYENVRGEITGRRHFTDTDDMNVEKCAHIGVVNGINAQGTLFSPDSALTREQAATMLSRLAEAIGRPLTGQTPAFADNADISAWAFDAVGQMQAAGVMGGVGNNTFAPADPYTREQSMVTILRMYQVSGGH